jgi:hypothetical protein
MYKYCTNQRTSSAIESVHKCDASYRRAHRRQPENQQRIDRLFSTDTTLLPFLVCHQMDLSDRRIDRDRCVRYLKNLQQNQIVVF